MKHAINKYHLFVLICVTLSSCETAVMHETGAAKGKGKWVGNSEFVKASGEVISLINNTNVNCHWVTATKTGGLNKKYIFEAYSTGVLSDNIIQSHSYSNCEINAEGKFVVRDAVQQSGIPQYSNVYMIPVVKTTSLSIHNRSESEQLAALRNLEAVKFMGMQDPRSATFREISENINKTWAVEVVCGSGRQREDFSIFHFPTKSKADAFAAAWKRLVAAMQ